MSGHGTIHWSELATGDVDGAKAFYTATAGWSFDEMPMPDGTYWVAKAGDQPVAGIMDIAGMGEGAQPAWMTYIAVDDVDKAVAQTSAGGGQVMRPPFDVPGVGRIAMMRDPGGAMIGMMTPANG